MNKKTLKPHDAIEWTQFAPDGTEEVRTGVVWCEAPRITGYRSAWWAVPDAPRQGEPTYVYVGRASQRRRVGRLSKSGKVYLDKAGRYVDSGDLVAESHPNSRTGRPTYNVPKINLGPMTEKEVTWILKEFKQ